MSESRSNGIATAAAWRAASQQARLESAERLRLPSGTTILASRPEPLEWILAGRLPQRLLGAVLQDSPDAAPVGREMTREEILELAEFAEQLVRATIVEPHIGSEAGEISFEEIPVQDRAFIFEWACRAWNTGSPDDSSKEDSSKEGRSIPPSGIERFRSE